MIATPVNYDYLIEDLRQHLGDTNPASYRYLDSWLRSSLCTAIKALQRRWNFKYVINSVSFYVERNPNWSYLYPDPPTIEQGDERAVILQAAIIVKSGSLENYSWDVGSWKDAEISYSNIEGNRSKEGSIERDQLELDSILKPPQKRLAYPLKRSLPGYINNAYERQGRH
jgi:hypothetical protein